MIRFKRSEQGFTVIELMVVIVVLCILGSLVALTYSGVQTKNRNAERQTEIDALRAQLESYYAQTNTYPTLTAFNNAEWRSKNLKTLKEATLEDPSWNNTINACTSKGKIAAANAPTANCYSYQVTTTDGSACDNNKAICAHYTLTAILEGSEKYVKSSLN
ncbi:MAG TPA: prepilin-type N-terminal cleavage/methylation domain-containing protein [Candidatus Saccharimonadales bacterium]|nr:prepilin-type N-terminal cleavage/methylation domain-containing protein [Candidatus Saccharimonadales bacterium]